MSLLSKIIAFILSLFGIASVMQPQTQNQIPENAETYSVKVMSYNIYVAGTGDRSPENRNPGIVSLIREQSPDVFGLQEAVYDRIQLLNESLSEYSYVGRGREKNEKDGEFSPVFYKTDKYNLVDSGTFWFSNTPHKASIAWGTVFKRICTWAVLEDKETGFRFGVFNSHWDHISFISRNNSAELLCEKIQEYAENLPVIIMGDFNCEPDTTAYQYLIEQGFLDCMYTAPGAVVSGTYHGYTKSDVSNDLPIDHILFKGDTGYAASYKAVTDKKDGIYPSDHFPIVSDIILYKEA